VSRVAVKYIIDRPIEEDGVARVGVEAHRR